MKHIETPVRYDSEDWMLLDADDQWLASLDAGEQGPQIAAVLNAHDALMDACLAARELLAGWHPSHPADGKKKEAVVHQLCEALVKGGK